jgi:hypothetical protein
VTAQTVTGGAGLKPDELNVRINRLRQNRFGALTRIQIVTLWDNWWLLLLFVALLSTEWFFRKKVGLV